MKASIASNTENSATAEEQAAHDAAMVAKAEQSGSQISTIDPKTGERTVLQGRTEADLEPADNGDPTTGRPDDVPEKFWDAEKKAVNTDALLKSYIELEKRGTPKPAAGDDPEPAAGDDPEPAAGESEQTAIMQTAAAEFAASGSLTDETYQSLESSGFPRAMVDQYIAGAKAQAAEHEATVLASAGTDRATFDSAKAWAAENLDTDEIKAFDTAVSGPGAAFAVKDLVARFQKGASRSGSLVSGGHAGSGVQAFENKSELQKAMRDPRYRTDPKFNAAVVARIAKTDAAILQ